MGEIMWHLVHPSCGDHDYSGPVELAPAVRARLGTELAAIVPAVRREATLRGGLPARVLVRHPNGRTYEVLDLLSRADKRSGDFSPYENVVTVRPAPTLRLLPPAGAPAG